MMGRFRMLGLRLLHAFMQNDPSEPAKFQNSRLGRKRNGESKQIGIPKKEGVLAGKMESRILP